MSDQLEPLKNDNEISLVDLLATVIRHRAWVLWITGIGAFGSLLVLFVLPLGGIVFFGAPSYTVQAMVRTSQLPADAQAYLGFDFSDIATNQARNLALVRSVYRETLMTKEQGQLDLPQFNRIIKDFVSKSLKIGIQSKAFLTVTLSVGASDQKKAVEFLGLFAEKLRQAVTDLTLPLIQSGIIALSPGTKKDDTTVTQQKMQDALRSLIVAPGFPLALMGSVDVTQDEPGTSRAVLAAMVILWSFLVGLLAAFAVEAVRRGRQNATTVELLKKAWKGQ